MKRAFTIGLAVGLAIGVPMALVAKGVPFGDGAAGAKLVVPFASSGDPADIERLTSLSPQLLEDLVAVGRVDPRSEDIAEAGLGLHADEAAESNRRLNLSAHDHEVRLYLLGGLVPPDEAQHQVAAIEEGLAEVTGLPEHGALAYVSNSFRHDTTDGISIDGDTARVVLRGAQAYELLSGDIAVDRQLQYDLRLVRDESATHGWRLVSQSSVFVDEADS